MYRVFTAAFALGGLLTSASVALAQTYPAAPDYPPPGNAGAYPPAYTAPTPPPPAYGQPWDGTHSDGGAARAYSYWGAQKSN